VTIADPDRPPYDPHRILSVPWPVGAEFLLRARSTPESA